MRMFYCMLCEIKSQYFFKNKERLFMVNTLGNTKQEFHLYYKEKFTNQNF